MPRAEMAGCVSGLLVAVFLGQGGRLAGFLVV